MNNYWSAIELFRSQANEIDGVKAVNHAGSLGNARAQFVHRVLLESAFNNKGDNRPLANEIKHLSNLCGDSAIDLIAKKTRQEATFAIHCHDPKKWDERRWKIKKIESRHIDLNEISPDIYKDGFHLIHAGIGSGKTSNVMLPLAKQHGRNTRALVIVPNKKRVYELASELGWAHYHTYGTSAEDVKQAIKSHDKLVICSGSLRHIEIPEIADNWWAERYEHIHVDELTEVLRQCSHHGKAGGSWFWQSLQTLFGMMRYCRNFWGYTADAPTGFTRAVMQVAANEYNQDAYYYKTLSSWGVEQKYGFADSQEDAIWTAVKWINSGRSAWGYIDVSDYEGEMTKVARLFSKLCPDKKIECWDSTKITEHPLGQPIRELGLVEYVKEKRRRGELDAIIFSPVARSQYSVLFDEAELDLAFDFSFAIIRSAEITSPWDADQGLGRARQTIPRIVYIGEQNGGIRAIHADDALKELEQHEEIDLSSASKAERIYWNCLACYKQFQLAGKASRRWLFEEIVKQKGAKIVPLDIKLKGEDSERYVAILKTIQEETLELLNDRIENDSTKRLELRNRVYERHPKGWGPLSPDFRDYLRLKELLKTDISGCETFFQIAMMPNEERQAIDEGFFNSFFVTTGSINDKIFSNLENAVVKQKRQNIFDWFLHGDENFWFLLNDDVLETADFDIASNYELIYKTLAPPMQSCGSLNKYLKGIGDLIGLEIVHKVARIERMKWREELRDEYFAKQAGKFTGIRRNAWTPIYQKIEELIRPRISEPNFSPSYAEGRFLDTLEGVVRVNKKPLIARSIIEVYRHFAFVLKDLEQDPEHPEANLHFLKNPLNRKMVSSGFSEKSAS